MTYKNNCDIAIYFRLVAYSVILQFKSQQAYLIFFSKIA